MEYEWPAHFQSHVVRSGFGGGKLSSYCLALEAWRRGLQVTFLPPDGTRVLVSDGETSVRFNHSRTDRITDEAYRVVESKYETSEALRNAGIPVPASYQFDTNSSDFQEIADTAESLGYPVVLKPVRGSVGRGVFANIRSVEDLRHYYNHLIEKLRVRRIVLERHHFGDDFRVYVVGNRYVAACKRIPANVVGDGRSTIDELIAQKNVVRRENPFLSGGLIVKDYEVKEMIRRAGYTLKSVLPAGEKVALREKANASAGGDVVDVTHELPERIQQASVQAVQAVDGLPAAGVDVLWDPVNSAGREDDFVIIEMNSRAHIGVNMYPTHGAGQDVPKALIDEYFPHTPRREADGFSDLVFDRQEIVEPIVNGVVHGVELNPAPDHGYPFRRIYSLSTGLAITRKGRAALTKSARKWGIAGELDLEGESPRLALGAKNHGDATRFYRTVVQVLGEKPQRTEQPCSPLVFGFRIR